MKSFGVDFGDLAYGVEVLIDDRTQASLDLLIAGVGGLEGTSEFLLLSSRHQAFGGLGNDVRSAFYKLVVDNSGQSIAHAVVKKLKQKHLRNSAKPPAPNKPPRGRPRDADPRSLAQSFAEVKGKRPEISNASAAAVVGTRFGVSKDTVLRAVKKFPR